MSLDSLKHGNEFICWWFKEGRGGCSLHKWSDEMKCFTEKLGSIDSFLPMSNVEEYFSYTTCVSSDGSQVSFDKVK